MKDQYHVVKSKCIVHADVVRLLKVPKDDTFKGLRDRVIFSLFFYTGN